LRTLRGAFAQGAKLGAEVRPTQLNGQPGLMLLVDGQIGSVMSLEIADGLIQTIRGVTNPDKLDHLGPVADARALLRRARTP
jgi:RNA polymerase sigma-70 factor, ECF subfamily